MATIDAKAYVTHGDAVGLGRAAVGIEDLQEALKAEVRRATAIMIFGGYFNRDYLLKLLAEVPAARRSDIDVRIAIGIEPARSAVEQWGELRKLRNDLAKKLKNVKVKAVQNRRHFHTKLFYFRRGTQPSWYVGSANPTGSARHEMMVRVSRKHPALSVYAEAVWGAARDVTHEPEDDVRTLSTFFASGFVAYRPARIPLFTFDVFQFKQPERRRLEQGINKRMEVPFSNVVTEGYGFQLAQALGDLDVQAVDSGDGPKRAARVHHRAYSVETVFGHWMPAFYKDEVIEHVEKVENVKVASMTRFVSELATPTGTRRAREAFVEYASRMNDYAQAHGVQQRKVSECVAKFDDFVKRRTALASDHARIARHCRSLVFTPMPDLSNDEVAAHHFEQSFFEDVVARSTGKNVPRIVQAIAQAVKSEPIVDTSDPKQWANALKRRLASRSWTTDEWT